MGDIYTPYINNPESMAILKASMHGELKYTLMNDFLAKYTLQNDLYALAGLLSALLDVELDEITDITILNPIELGGNMDDKDYVLDIKLELNHEKIINIEIQARYQEYWAERTITYLCRIFDQLREGESYQNIRECIHIGILSKDIFKKHDPRYTGEFYSEYKLLETTHHTEYSSKLAIKMLSLSHLEEVPEEERISPNSLYYWAKMFNAHSWEELTMIAENNPRMESFVGTVKQLTAEEKVAQVCEARRRWSNDVATYEQEIKNYKSELESVKEEVEQYKDEAVQLNKDNTELRNRINELEEMLRLKEKDNNG